MSTTPTQVAYDNFTGKPVDSVGSDLADTPFAATTAFGTTINPSLYVGIDVSSLSLAPMVFLSQGSFALQTNRAALDVASQPKLLTSATPTAMLKDEATAAASVISAPNFQQAPGEPPWTSAQAISAYDQNSYERQGFIGGDPATGVAGDPGAADRIGDANTEAQVEQGETALYKPQPWLSTYMSDINSQQFSAAQSLMIEGSDWDANNIQFSAAAADGVSTQGNYSGSNVESVAVGYVGSVNLVAGFGDLAAGVADGALAVGGLAGTAGAIAAAVAAPNPGTLGAAGLAMYGETMLIQATVNDFTAANAQAALKVIITGLDNSAHWEADMTPAGSEATRAIQATPQLTFTSSYINSLENAGMLKAGALNGIHIVTG